MSKAKLQYARELIQEKQYAKARAVLKEIDHPTAYKWLSKLDELDPPTRARINPIVLVPVSLIVVSILILIAFLVGRSSRNQDVPAVAQLATNTASDFVARPTIEPTST